MINKIEIVYPSALSEEEWQLIMPQLPQDNLVGRPRHYEWRDILNGIFFYGLRTGCQWRYLPVAEGLPSWQTVYRYFHKLGDSGWWQKLSANRRLARDYNGCQRQVKHSFTLQCVS